MPLGLVLIIVGLLVGILFSGLLGLVLILLGVGMLLASGRF